MSYRMRSIKALHPPRGFEGRAIIPLCFGIPRLPGTQLNSGRCDQFDAHCGRREPNGRSMFVHRMNSGRPATCRATAAGSADVSQCPTPPGDARPHLQDARRVAQVGHSADPLKRLSPRSRGAAWSSTRCVTQQLRLPVHRPRRVAGAPQRAVSQRLRRGLLTGVAWWSSIFSSRWRRVASRRSRRRASHARSAPCKGQGRGR